ncbi:hypothetical protein [Luteolibacter marinus]|uniref:hypothetical protein n=1 Tax=Luteolibacter marinus TaxID=2776705 RepID=UPI00186624D9|nr:hypothetical protein [Luteolibacter marinus]
MAPDLAKEADALLDLRELLMTKGHAGKCVRAFFHLFAAAKQDTRPKLAPLQAWLEEHLEISVHADGRELETLPVELHAIEDLDSFCMRSIKKVRMDRSFAARRLDLAFRYKGLAV